jgi:C1A family cysteine protease
MGLPIQFGIEVYTSFESQTAAAQGIILCPDPTTEQLLGGHALVLVGYNHPAQTLLFRNSWGTGWGQSGYATIPYAYITDPNLCSELYVLRRLQQT